MARHRPSSRPLADYEAKRDPARTPEPFGSARPAGGNLFVIQQHAARRMHYDLRLELDGTLKSWAVPKGPSVRAHEKRLAVHVEDHPIDYTDFEGVIPRGNYGAGPVIVWDRGWYRDVKPGDPREHLAQGKLEVEFFGYKMRGRWTLARMSGKDKDWLLLKKADEFAGDEELTDRFPESVLSGLTIEQRRDAPRRLVALRERLARQPVMLASLAERPFSDPGWLYEIKYDGVRVLASRNGPAIELLGRHGTLFTSRYPEIVAALRTLALERFLLDGEIVAFDERGRPSFQRLQPRMHLSRPADIERARALVPVSAVFFDALSLDGRDLRALPLAERKACLALVVPPRGVIRYGEHVERDGEAFYDAVCEQELEGVVGKRARSPYTGGRSRDWLKVKCVKRQPFVIGGYTDPQGSRGYFGALHLGVYENGRLMYVSKVGTGFDEGTLRVLWDKLAPLRRASTPFDEGAPRGRGHHWVEPRLVAEVRFSDWTDDGGIRHPAFLGLREDKRPEDCRRDAPPDLADSAPADAVARPTADADAPRVRITHPDKVFWPEERLTKGDLVGYYEAVAPLLLPYLIDRPLVLTRYPDGIRGKFFYQKDAPEFAPSWIRTVRIRAEEVGRDIDYIVVDDVDALRYVINLGTIPIHLWASRAASLAQPDWLVLDLDPKGAPFTDVVKVARALHRILERLELPGYVKTSGATGLHILLPLGARYSYEETRTFAQLLATLGMEAEPTISTLARPLRARGGKVYIDWGQNGHGQTIVAPFSVRPLPGAPVSCPLRWDEVTPQLDPRRFTITTAPRRFAEVGDPLKPVLGGGIDIAAALERINAGRA